MQSRIERASIFLCTASFACTLASAQDAAESAPDDASPSDLVESVVYTTIRPPNLDIYLYERPGAAPRRLTDSPALDYNAEFSPNGRWLVFTSGRAGGGDLFAADLQGGAEPIQLTRHAAFDDAAAFSPDGERLAFVSTRDGDADIFVMPFLPEDPAAGEMRAVNLRLVAGGDAGRAASFFPAASEHD